MLFSISFVSTSHETIRTGSDVFPLVSSITSLQIYFWKNFCCWLRQCHYIVQSPFIRLGARKRRSRKYPVFGGGRGVLRHFHLNYIIFFRPLFAQFEVAGALHSIYLSSYFEDHQWPSSASSAARPIKGKGEEEIVHVLSVRSLQFINLKSMK